MSQFKSSRSTRQLPVHESDSYCHCSDREATDTNSTHHNSPTHLVGNREVSTTLERKVFASALSRKSRLKKIAPLAGERGGWFTPSLGILHCVTPKYCTGKGQCACIARCAQLSRLMFQGWIVVTAVPLVLSLPMAARGAMAETARSISRTTAYGNTPRFCTSGRRFHQYLK